MIDIRRARQKAPRVERTPRVDAAQISAETARGVRFKTARLLHSANRMYATQLLIGAMFALACTFGCAAKEKKARSRGDFCEEWAHAACSKETVSACQAGSAEDCQLGQQDFCRTLVPEDKFSDAHGDDCLDAISAAYEDANLDADELATVLRLGPPLRPTHERPQGRG